MIRSGGSAKKSPATKPKTIVLALGNDLLADDGAALLAARSLKRRLGKAALVTHTAVSGMALLEELIGFERAVILDVICSPDAVPGSVFELDPKTFRPCSPGSPHYVGLPEMLQAAESLGVPFPRDVRIVAMGAEDVATVGGRMTRKVRRAVPEMVRITEQILMREATYA